MGFFDDLKKFSDEWGGKATETLRNLSPTTQAIGGELDKITGKKDGKLIWENLNDNVQNIISETPQAVSKAWDETAPKVTETLRNLSPTTQAIGGELDKITGQNEDKLIVEKVGETIQNIPEWYVETTKKNIEGAAQGARDVLDNTTSTIEKTIIVPVKETVQNVTKGVSEALPILAIGAGGLILASLLLGRR